MQREGMQDDEGLKAGREGNVAVRLPEGEDGAGVGRGTFGSRDLAEGKLARRSEQVPGRYGEYT